MGAKPRTPRAVPPGASGPVGAGAVGPDGVQGPAGQQPWTSMYPGRHTGSASFGRSPAGRLRNFGAMSPDKLENVWHTICAELGDPGFDTDWEAVVGCYRELPSRTVTVAGYVHCAWPPCIEACERAGLYVMGFGEKAKLPTEVFAFERDLDMLLGDATCPFDDPQDSRFTCSLAVGHTGQHSWDSRD